MIQLPKGYLEDEERLGFVISAEMKSYWAAQLEVLSLFDRICTKYGLKYYAAYGTLLGAARHNGFIPWDDDMDVCMFREDYETFIKVSAYDLPDGYGLISSHTNAEWNNTVLRLVNSDRINPEEPYLLKYHGCPYPCGLDIFPFDYMPDDLKERESKDNYIELAMSLAGLSFEDASEEAVRNSEYGDSIALLENEFNYKFHIDSTLGSQFISFSDYIITSYGKRGSIVTNYWNYIDHSKGYIFHKLWFSETIDLGFELVTIKAPIGVEAVLNICYGNNFMTPVRSGGAHDYPCYKSFIEILEKNDLTEYVNEKRDFINKCLYSADVKLIEEEAKEPLPAECLSFFAGKKVILYVLNSANILRYKEQVYDKIERAIQTFEAAKDSIAIILTEDITFQATLNAMYPDVFEKYIALRQSVADKELGIVSDSLYYDYASVCDAYYGDGTTVMGDFMKAKKPVMLQNYTL